MYGNARFKFYLLLSTIFVLLSCNPQHNNSFSFTGEWTIESYHIYTEVDSEILNDQTYKDAGFFRFKNDGTGIATIQIPGISLPQNNPISWSYHQDSDKLSIDYNTGQEPIVYHVSHQSKESVELLYDLINQSEDTNSLFRTIINLSKKN